MWCTPLPYEASNERLLVHRSPRWQLYRLARSPWVFRDQTYPLDFLLLPFLRHTRQATSATNRNINVSVTPTPMPIGPPFPALAALSPCSVEESNVGWIGTTEESLFDPSVEESVVGSVESPVEVVGGRLSDKHLKLPCSVVTLKSVCSRPREQVQSNAVGHISSEHIQSKERKEIQALFDARVVD